jgi:hypothetical protein
MTEPRPAARSAPLQLMDFQPLRKGALRGFATVELPIGLRIRDVPVFVGANGAFAALPRKPSLDRERRQRTIGGALAYEPVLEWRSRDLADRFAAAVVDLVRQAHPDAIGDVAAAA